MTLRITVSVNGNYKVPVTVESADAASTTTEVSGRGSDGLKSQDFNPPHGATVTIGPEEQDNGDSGDAPDPA